jgi:hypothetical protein
MKKLAMSLVATIALSVLIAGSTATTAAAYGNTAIYQIEFSLNCVDKNAQCVSIFGLGGFWGWIELDQGGTGDAAVSGCAHGLPGVPHGGAGGGPLEVTWTATTTNGDPFLTDPGGNYLFVPQVGLTFPATAGHYSSNVFGTVIQVQVVKIPGR